MGKGRNNISGGRDLVIRQNVPGARNSSNTGALERDMEDLTSHGINVSYETRIYSDSEPVRNFSLRSDSSSVARFYEPRIYRAEWN